MSDVILQKDNKYLQNILFWWFWLRAGYLEYQKSKKMADAMADNEANKIKIAWEIEERVIREQISLLDALGQADRYNEYRNLYNVLTKAIPKISYTGDDMPIDPDKLKRLKDLSKEFESDDLQEIVAKIIAWEYNNPGKYSLQTMAVVKNLTKSDLDLFTKASWLIIHFITRSKLNSKNNVGFIFGTLFSLWRDTRLKIKSQWFTYNDYLHLRELWLISSIESGFDLWAGKSTLIVGNGAIRLKNENKISLTWPTFLTRAGEELYSLITPVTNPVFLMLSKEEFLRQWFTEIL